MRRVLFGIVGCLFAIGCSTQPPEESIGEGAEPLDVTQTSGLTKKQGALASDSSETDRETDTQSYYDTVTVDTLGSTIGTGLPNLTAFKNKYFSSGVEQVAYYYNRGDLGIGREMHCVDDLTSGGGWVACYVRNFSAARDTDLSPEFQFGLSSDIAFDNMAASHAFATVAMVFRNDLSPSSPNNVFFVVYGPDENLAKAAALDRTGVLFAKNSPAASNATNGVNFNNHIPTNCIACHGGGGFYSNNLSNKTVTGALFLPFDLDQFDYQNVAGRTRTDQLTAFKHLNEMVWKVAALSGSDVTSSGATPLRSQLNTWYTNTVLASNPINEVFENDFDSNQVPSGWNTTLGKPLYQNMVRASCRNCHQANMLHPFDTEAQFASLLPTAVNDLCSWAMPHSLQTLRQFWQSSQPAALANYLTATNNPSLAATLQGTSCGQGNVVTLDPPLISAVLY